MLLKLVGIVVVLVALAVQLVNRFAFYDRLQVNPNSSKPYVNTTEYDYIVVGAGPAGCVLANRLSSSGKYRVLLLEAGSSDNYMSVMLPAAFAASFKTPLDWGFESAQDDTLNNRVHYMPRGKMLGGTASLNANMYVRGHPEDFNNWEKLGATGWNYDAVLPYFKRSERNVRAAINTDYHGTTGEWVVNDHVEPHAIMKDVVTAFAATVKIPVTDDLNNPNQTQAVGFSQVNIHRGLRHSPADAFLNKDVLARPNLTVKVLSQATRVLFDAKKRATGVQFVDTTSGTTYVAKAKREVVISGGTINSPHLLMNSGIGNANELKRHGIAVVHDNANVGQNLQDHFSIVTIFNTTKPSSLHTEEGIGNLLKWAILGQGPLTSNVPEVSAFVKVSEDEPVYDVQYLGAPALFIHHGFTKFPGQDGISIGAYILRPHSRGSITLQSGNPMDKPIITMNSLRDERDMNLLVKVIKQVRTIAKHSTIASWIDTEMMPGKDVQTDEQIKEYIRNYGNSLYHLTSTCAMGPKDTSVVNPQLQVYGVKGLRVADSSVMPQNLRANVAAATVMIAERCAEFMLQQ